MFKEATKLIVGTLPPPRFTQGLLKEGDVNFSYGSRDGQLWPILDRIFGLNLKYETTVDAVIQRKNFLKCRNIGICDIVASAQREKINASDVGMQHIQLRNLVEYLEEYTKVDTLLFTGGNSKNGPEYFFRKHLKDYQLSLTLVSDVVPRIHKFDLPTSIPMVENTGNEKVRTVRTVSLTAPSGAANRAVGSLEAYKQMKAANPSFTTVDFRVMQYREFF